MMFEPPAHSSGSAGSLLWLSALVVSTLVASAATYYATSAHDAIAMQSVPSAQVSSITPTSPVDVAVGADGPDASEPLPAVTTTVTHQAPAPAPSTVTVRAPAPAPSTVTKTVTVPITTSDNPYCDSDEVGWSADNGHGQKDDTFDWYNITYTVHNTSDRTWKFRYFTASLVMEDGSTDETYASIKNLAPGQSGTLEFFPVSKAPKDVNISADDLILCE